MTYRNGMYHGSSEGTRIGKPKANAGRWKHPAGHATWCASAVPFNRHPSVGGTIMARSQCSCPRNRVAVALRKLAATPGGEAA